MDPAELPINQNWSWDRILRSCLIKQADVLQGLYFFENEFDLETHRKNFEFYEARTVHESSLSPCIHAILALKLDMREKAYEMYLRTSRLDLNDFNNDTEDGLHITSMAGTWLSIVEGFGGMRVENDMLSFNPKLPSNWKSLTFKLLYRGHHLNIYFDRSTVIINDHIDNQPLEIQVNGKKYDVTTKISVPQ
jgi:maltose phosphorylase